MMQYSNMGPTGDLYNFITYYLVCHDVCVRMLYKISGKTHFLQITSSCLSSRKTVTCSRFLYSGKLFPLYKREPAT